MPENCGSSTYGNQDTGYTLDDVGDGGRVYVGVGVVGEQEKGAGKKVGKFDESFHCFFHWILAFFI